MNIEQRTSNIERRSQFDVRRSVFDVRCSRSQSRSHACSQRQGGDRGTDVPETRAEPSETGHPQGGSEAANPKAETYLLHLLPALPSGWPAGRVTGLRARGGFEVDIEWDKGILSSARIRSGTGGKVTLQYGDKRAEVDVPDDEDLVVQPNLF